jgi:hypothetical protein
MLPCGSGPCSTVIRGNDGDSAHHRRGGVGGAGSGDVLVEVHSILQDATNKITEYRNKSQLLFSPASSDH